MNALQVCSVVLRIVCALLAWAFVFRYSKVTWDRTGTGRFVMSLTLIIALFMTIAVISAFVGPADWIIGMALMLYVWVMGVLISQHRLFNSAQREREDEEEGRQHQE